MTGPQVHDPAPDVSLLDLSAREATLSEFWRRGLAVVVFLRYFGCPFCQAQVAHLRDERERFEELGAGLQSRRDDHRIEGQVAAAGQHDSGQAAGAGFDPLDLAFDDGDAQGLKLLALPGVRGGAGVA